MKDRRDEGSWAWRQAENHNHMIELQGRSGAPRHGSSIELAYFGGSAFRIVSPAGLSILIDPWRNPPWGTWDWYLYDFPRVNVDVGVSTHAHFDHDALHALSAHTLLERLIGTYEFNDVRITGIADKHVSDSTHNVYDWAGMTQRLTNMETKPPNNWRSFDNCLLLIETAGMRILHWGDNRPDPPETIWERIGNIDVALLPIDGSFHVLSPTQIDTIIARLDCHEFQVEARECRCARTRRWRTRLVSPKQDGPWLRAASGLFVAIALICRAQRLVTRRGRCLNVDKGGPAALIARPAVRRETHQCTVLAVVPCSPVLPA